MVIAYSRSILFVFIVTFFPLNNIIDIFVI
jgi:hypothetical protein